MENEQLEQNRFEGWAIVEIYGHQKYAGKVSTQFFGVAAMFRIDVPELKERTRVTEGPEYVRVQEEDPDLHRSMYVPSGTSVTEAAVQGYTKFFGPGAIFSITPCTEEAAVKAVEALQPRTPLIVSVPAGKALTAGQPGLFTVEDRDDDDYEEERDEHDFDEDDKEDDEEILQPAPVQEPPSSIESQVTKDIPF